MTVSKFTVKQVPLVFTSFGLKTRLRREESERSELAFPKADYYIDCRHMTEKGLLTDKLTDWLTAFQRVNEAQLRAVVRQVIDAIERIPDRRGESKTPFQVAFFCAWGQHRSKTTKVLVADALRQQGFQVLIGDPS